MGLDRYHQASGFLPVIWTTSFAVGSFVVLQDSFDTSPVPGSAPRQPAPLSVTDILEVNVELNGLLQERPKFHSPPVVLHVGTHLQDSQPLEHVVMVGELSGRFHCLLCLYLSETGSYRHRVQCRIHYLWRNVEDLLLSIAHRICFVHLGTPPLALIVGVAIIIVVVFVVVVVGSIKSTLVQHCLS